MPSASRTKGYEAERAFALAVGGRRMPLSGALPDYPGDVEALGLRWQVKQRRNGQGWRMLNEWLKGHDALALHQPYRGWLVVIPLDRFLDLVPKEETG